MLKLLNMLRELLSKTNMTFEELAMVVRQLRALGAPPAPVDEVAYRAWLRALLVTLRGILSRGDEVWDVAELCLNECWPVGQRLMSVLDTAEPLPAPASVEVMGPVRELARAGDEPQLAMVWYTLGVTIRLLRT